jgi:general stress protein YciG
MDRRLSLGGLKPKPSSVTGRRSAGVAASTSSAQFGDDVTINQAAPDSDAGQVNGGKEANDTMVKVNSGEKGGETQHIEHSWIDTLWGRKRKGRDRNLDV